MHEFFDTNAYTALKTKGSPKYPAWRPDKVVTQPHPKWNKKIKPYWQPSSARIVGQNATPAFKAKGEETTLVWEDGIVRTPSDHYGIVAEFTYTNAKPVMHVIQQTPDFGISKEEIESGRSEKECK